MRLTIGRKSLFSFLVVSLLPLMVFSVISIRQQSQLITQYAEEEAIDQAGVLAASIIITRIAEKTQSLFDNHAELQHFVEDFYKRCRRDVVVIDVNRTVLADQEPWNVGSTFPHFEDPDGAIRLTIERTLRDGASGSFVERSSDGVFELVSAPVTTSDGKIVGAVLVEYSQLYEAAQQRIGDLEFYLVSVLAVVAVIASIVALLLSRNITRPIRTLMAAVRTTGEGDLSQRVAVTSNDETGDLAIAFNRMAEHLAKVTISKADLQAELTERKRVETALSESERKYRSLFENSLDGSFLLSDVFVDCNEEGCRIFGRSREEILGSTPESLSPALQPDGAESAPQAKRIMQAAMDGKKQHYFWRLHHPDGTPVDVEVFLAAVPVGGRRLLQATVHDVTERRRAELKLQNYAAALEAANRELEKSNVAAEAATRAKSEFLANMSHEIRTPMTAILGYANILADSVKEPTEIEAAATIKRNGEHLLRIINDILDLAKVEAGKMMIERTACSPRAVLEDVISLMKVRADEKNLALTAECEGAIPDTIHSDPTRLRQILVNLVGNAIKFTDVGGVKITMGLLTYVNRMPQMRFHVTDTGIGMTKELLTTIFQPFSQGHRSLHMKYGGTGLGLAISRRLAEALGGSITAESEVGVGSTFSLTVDAGMLNEAVVDERRGTAEQPDKKHADWPNAAAVKLNCRILLVEDGPDNQRLLTFLLTRAGAETVVVENGELAIHTALKAVEEGRPFDVVLMDMQMPVLDGYEATRQLRNAGYSHPIVALTAHAMNHDCAQCLRAGCDAYLAKPVDRHILLQTVAKLAAHPSRPIGSATQMETSVQAATTPSDHPSQPAAPPNEDPRDVP